MPTSSGRGARCRRHAPPLALSAGIAGLLTAWVFTLPPGAAPDEREHYVKAVGAGALELAGSRRPPSAAQERAFLALIRSVSHRPGISVRERSSLDWSVRNTRTFTVPARLIPHFDCGAWQRHEQHFLGVRCGRGPPARGDRVASYVGPYPPWLYVLPGVLMRGAPRPDPATRIGRAPLAALVCLLLLGTVWLAWRPDAGPVSLLGPLVALGPGLFTIGAALGGSGAEIAGAACLTAALLRIAARGGRARAAVWWAAAGAALVLALARPAGPELVLAVVALVALLCGPRRVWAAFRAGGRPALVAAAVAAGGVLLGLGWALAEQPATAGVGPGDVLDTLGTSVGRLPAVLQQAFASALPAIPVPWPVDVIWAAMLVVLLLAAARAGGPATARRVLALVGGAFVVLVVADSAALHVVGGLQGRYALPLLVVVPLWAGSQLRRPAPGLTAAFFTAALAAQLSLWWSAARRFALPDHPSTWFLAHPVWSPPGGWAPWLVLVVVSTLGWAVAGAGPAVIPRSARPGRSG